MCQAESGQTVCKAPDCDRPIYVESNGIRHPFCGRTCASKYGGYVYNFSTPAGKFCKRAGCNKPTFAEPNGQVHPYCGRSCAYNDIALSQNGLINLGTTIEQLNSTRLSPMSTASSNSTISSDSCEEFVVIED